MNEINREINNEKGEKINMKLKNGNTGRHKFTVKQNTPIVIW